MRMYRSLSVGIVFLCVLVLTVGCQSSRQQVMAPEPDTDQVQLETELQQAPEKMVSDSAEVPILEVEKTVHDFGEMGPDSYKRCKFTFKNTGSATLKIDRVQSTCGCTVPELKKKVYAPGESGVINVTFKAPGKKGDVDKHLYVVSNDPRKPRFELGIKAMVTVKVSISPENVNLYLNKDNAGMPNIVVKSLDDREFSIKSVTIGRDVMKIKFDPAQKAKEFVLEPVVNKEKLNEFNIGVIQVKTDHPQAGTLAVRYNAKPAYAVSKSQIILQNIVPGESIVKEVTIVSNYGTPVEIESAVSKNGYMEIESQEKEGENMRLKIKITPPEQKSKKYLTDQLELNLIDGNKLSIRCSGWFDKFKS